MNLRICFALLLVSANFSILPAQDIAELSRRNGFKDIKLASPIDSVKGAILRKEFMEQDEFPARLFKTEDSAYKSIGEVSVREIIMMTYKNLIYKIVITTDKDPRVMQALEKSFGKSTYVLRTTSYNWKGENISLTFRARRNSIELIYRSYPIIRMMLEDKGKKVDEIAEDF